MEAPRKSPNAEAEVPNDSNGNPVVNALAAKFKGFDFLSNANAGKPLFSMPSVSYPAEVERRLKALKKLQVDMFNTECKFFEELHELEMKYAALHSAHCNKRSEIVLGKREPTDEECDFTIPGAEEEKEAENEEKKNTGDTPISGVPRFWLTIFQNVEQFADMVEDQDIPVLEHLEDVKMELTKEPMGFHLSFYFKPNDYFTNSVLTKTYEMRIRIDPKDPFSFEGTEIYKSVGCKINWNEGKNVTVREMKKKQKHKSTGAIRMTSKMISTPSFFDFFDPPQIDDKDDDIDPELQDKLTLDFELGSFLKERLIPRAVLYFTGEALVSDDEEEDDFTDEDTEGEEEESGNEPQNDSATEDEGENQ